MATDSSSLSPNQFSLLGRGRASKNSAKSPPGVKSLAGMASGAPQPERFFFFFSCMGTNGKHYSQTEEAVQN